MASNYNVNNECARVLCGTILYDVLRNRYARPAPGYSDHRTPVGGLYLASAGTHPGGGVMGACGRNCAMAVLADLGKANM